MMIMILKGKLLRSNYVVTMKMGARNNWIKSDLKEMKTAILTVITKETLITVMMEMVMMTRTMPVRCRTFSTSFKLVHPQFPLFFLNQSSSQSCYFFQTFIIIW